jgi:antitoxin component HigA of HigAB toxin-antitoxin module
MTIKREKTYRKYLNRIEKLISLDPASHTKNGKALIRYARAVEKYEKIHFPLDHTKRRLRGDLAK